MGAWIETAGIPIPQPIPEVAPHVGAWIETWVLTHAYVVGNLSRPTWARGLKQRHKYYRSQRIGRAPRGRVD